VVACSKLGANVLFLNTAFSGPQLTDVAQREQPKALIYDHEFEELIHDASRRRKRFIAWHDAEEGKPKDPLLEEMSASGDVAPVSPPSERGKAIILTSGTTGPPKGARRPPVHSLAPAAAILSAIPVRAGEPVLIAAPLLHTWGFAALQIAALHGAPVVLRSRFDPADFLRTVEEHRIDAVFAVPVMLQRVMQLPAGTLDAAWSAHRPRIVALSGSALPAGLATAFMDRFGDVLYNLYGSTEVSWVSIASPADLRAAPGTAGRAPVGTTLVVLDEDDRPVPPGVEGRVYVRNDMIFEGYTRDGADVPRSGRLVGTGDVGRLDENGLLHLTGRADDMIVSGGENVHPGPVEELLAARPEVREVAVTGVPDERFGQALAAYVVLQPGATVDADDVRGWVRAELSRFAVPRDVEFLDELPRNATGKVVHRELRGRR
jgi:acyl-CoA synthetase (AMP-forming)/AMP-acid ligase II